MKWFEHEDFKYRKPDNLWTSDDFEPVDDESEILQESFRLHGDGKVNIGFIGRRVRSFFVQKVDGRIRATYLGQQGVFHPEYEDWHDDKKLIMLMGEDSSGMDLACQIDKFRMEVGKGVLEDQDNPSIWAKDEETFEKRGGKNPKEVDFYERGYDRINFLTRNMRKNGFDLGVEHEYDFEDETLG